MYGITCLIALIGFLLVGWITYQSFAKFVRDGAQLADDEEEENEILNESLRVKNRIGMTTQMLNKDLPSDGIESMLSEHE